MKFWASSTAIWYGWCGTPSRVSEMKVTILLVDPSMTATSPVSWLAWYAIPVLLLTAMYSPELWTTISPRSVLLTGSRLKTMDGSGGPGSSTSVPPPAASAASAAAFEEVVNTLCVLVLTARPSGELPTSSMTWIRALSPAVLTKVTGMVWVCEPRGPPSETIVRLPTCMPAPTRGFTETVTMAGAVPLAVADSHFASPVDTV